MDQYSKLLRGRRKYLQAAIYKLFTNTSQIRRATRNK